MKKHSQFNEGKNIFNSVEFELKRKKIKNLIIRLNSRNKIVVSIPLKISDEILVKFLELNLDKFNKYSQEKENKKSINEKENWFYLFGEKIFYDVDNESKKMIINNKKISLLNKTKTEAINQYRKKELKVYLLVRQLQLTKIMNIENHVIIVRNKVTAWATNHVNKKTIYYSINLSSFSKEIIDYVIVHELAHNKFANHSQDFWNLVKFYEENYKIKRSKLKKYIYS
ncbi:M48 family metallopeptidase [Mesomycoplasma moatsii]|uniref:M48 family metallopeptidase n=1 Tax=Mesomycoplasma moatsii TaxID=171287 RepID=UPI0003B4067C